MNDKTEWIETLFAMAIWIGTVIVIVLLVGCTATSLQQREAQAAAIKGTYVDGIGCTRMRVASGTAAVAAAQENKARQVQIP